MQQRMHLTARGFRSQIAPMSVITIENVRVQMVNHGDPGGPLNKYKNFDFRGYRSDNAVIRNVIVSGGSSGVWIGCSANPLLTNWAACNVSGLTLVFSEEKSGFLE